MKTIIRKCLTTFLYTACIICGFSSCNDFEELNQDPTKASTIDPNTQLTNALLCIGGDWGVAQPFAFYYCGFVQHLQGDYSTTSDGGEYLNSDYEFQAVWDRMYTVLLKNLVDGINRTQGDSSMVNANSALRITKVFYSTIITDMFGDVPYFDACKGYISGNVKPAYDKQELIYKDMLKELTEAEANLNENGDALSGDIIYKGDIAKWKSLANALNLRLAMRLTKVEPEFAHEQVKNILSRSSGMLKSNADNALVEMMDMLDWDYNEHRRNGLSQLWRGRENYPTCYICSTFWNKMKDTSDPRLLRIGRCYDESSTNPFSRNDVTEYIMNKSGNGINQLQPVKPGFYWWDNWPNGFWDADKSFYWDKACRPMLNNAFIKGNCPGIICTYAEQEYLLAEANSRWNDLNDNTTAEQHYNNAVRASMDFLNSNYNINKIGNDEINSFLSANPFPSDAEGRIKTINEQLWIYDFLNPAEAYSNWRRSGYPELKSSVEYGAKVKDSQSIPRRLFYPLTEQTYNPEGYYSAVKSMGGTDSWNAHVWWDK